ASCETSRRVRPWRWRTSRRTYPISSRSTGMVGSLVSFCWLRFSPALSQRVTPFTTTGSLIIINHHLLYKYRIPAVEARNSKTFHHYTTPMLSNLFPDGSIFLKYSPKHGDM